MPQGSSTHSAEAPGTSASGPPFPYDIGEELDWVIPEALSVLMSRDPETLSYREGNRTRLPQHLPPPNQQWALSAQPTPLTRVAVGVGEAVVEQAGEGILSRGTRGNCSLESGAGQVAWGSGITRFVEGS